MTGNISILNRSERVAEIHIEGVIGVPESWQFADNDDRVATYDKFRSQLAEVRELRAPQIVVNIRSTGGNVNDAILIYDALQSLDAQITTRCYGYVASAATLIAQAGSAGRREMSANGLYLIHKSACNSEGNSNDLSQAAELLDKTDERIASIYAARSGRTAAHFTGLMNLNNGNGKWLSAQEACEAGLVDAILPAAATTGRPANRLQAAPRPDLSDFPLNLTLNDPSMTIRQHWNAILDLLGATFSTSHACAPAQSTEPGQQPADTIAAEAPAPSAEKPRTEAPAALSARGNLNHPAAPGDLSQLNNPAAPGNPADTNLPGDPAIAAYRAEIETLKQQVDSLQSQNARLQAKPTQTKPREDPSPGESRLSGNALSYDEDIRNFKQ